jgi:hypothetical protein
MRERERMREAERKREKERERERAREREREREMSFRPVDIFINCRRRLESKISTKTRFKLQTSFSFFCQNLIRLLTFTNIQYFPTLIGHFIPYISYQFSKYSTVVNYKSNGNLQVPEGFIE